MDNDKNQHPNWGGKRPNSGRKPMSEEQKQVRREKTSHSYYCSDEEAKELRDYLNNVIRQRKDR